MNKEVISLFPTPVGIYQIDIDLGLVYKNLSKFKTGPHGLLEDSNSSYDQDSSVLYDEDFKDLHMKIQTCLDDYVSIVQLQPLVVTGSWYNEMNVGCKVNLHRHEGSVVSGAFYVNTNLGDLHGSNFFRRNRRPKITPNRETSPIWHL